MTANVWTPEALRDHLQKAVYLELWTIPIYLSAAYSLQVPGTSAANPPALKPIRGKQNPRANREQLGFNNIYSVVVQEMLHLELACNLYNALFGPKGSSPKMTGDWAPRYDRFPPWIGVKMPVQLGPANSTQLALMSAIETPEPKCDAPPSGPQAVYDSIGQFYKAIQQGVDQLFASLYDPSADLKQKSEFSDPQYPGDDYTGFSNVISGDAATARAQADKMIAAIVDEGEGRIGPIIPEDFRPEDASDIEDDFSHYSRFRFTQAMLKFGGPFATYPTNGSSELAAAQNALNSAYSKFLSTLESGFSGDADLDLSIMWQLPGLIVAVWAAGGVPEFNPNS